MARQCGSCTLCCKLLPMKPAPDGQLFDVMAKMVDAGVTTAASFIGMRPEWAKAAGVRCVYQHAGKGCAIYPQRPFSCRGWQCQWLAATDTADLSRPDRSHYVIDVAPDMVSFRDNSSGEMIDVPAVKVWLDPDYPDAHRDPALRAFLERRASAGWTAKIILGSDKSFVLMAPVHTREGRWREAWPPEGAASAPERDLTDFRKAFGLSMEVITDNGDRQRWQQGGEN